MSGIKVASQTRLAGWRRLLLVAAGVLVLALTAERIWLALAQPLWFDEAWTLAVARAPDWRAVVHEARADVNAPLFYLFAHLWTGLAGSSDLALRAPSLVAVALAGLAPVLARPPGLSRGASLAWGAMVFAWWGVDVFLDGRCYGVLLAFSTWQAALYARLLRAPSGRSAWAWAAVAAAAILTHYFALIPTAAQGLIYLAARRRRAVRTWPAALAFAPAAGWIAWHAPRLRQFAAAGVAWHPAVDAAAAVRLTGATLMASGPAAGLAIAALAVAAALGWRGAPERDAAPSGPLWLTAAASLAGLAAALAVGAIHASLTARYLIPVAPGLLLGLVLCARRTARPQIACAALAGAYLVAALRPAAFADGLKAPVPYGFEDASAALVRAGASDVVFVWDQEANRIMEPASLARVGGVFFARAGYPVRIHPLQVAPGDDVNRRALAAAMGPRPGLIWLYNREGRTAARAHPPDIPALDARWTCRRWGDADVGTLACWRATPGPATLAPG
jgi:hypothetical protein